MMCKAPNGLTPSFISDFIGIKPCFSVVYHQLTTLRSHRLRDLFHEGAARGEINTQTRQTQVVNW